MPGMSESFGASLHDLLVPIPVIFAILAIAWVVAVKVSRSGSWLKLNDAPKYRSAYVVIFLIAGLLSGTASGLLGRSIGADFAVIAGLSQLFGIVFWCFACREDSGNKLIPGPMSRRVMIAPWGLGMVVTGMVMTYLIMAK